MVVDLARTGEHTLVQDEHALEHTLVQSAADGDVAAFGQLYHRHAAGLFDLIVRTVDDPRLADEILQTTFVMAWRAVRKGWEVGHPQAWLFTIANNVALEATRTKDPERSGVSEPGRANADLATVDAGQMTDPRGVAGDRKLVELVWSTARSLDQDDYAALDMHLRHGVPLAAMAEQLGTTLEAMRERLERTCRSVESVVIAEVLLTRGRAACAGLEATVNDLGLHYSRSDGRAAIWVHVATCPVCEGTRRQVADPLDVFAALAPVPFTETSQLRVWARIRQHIADSPWRPRLLARSSVLSFVVGATALTLGVWVF